MLLAEVDAKDRIGCCGLKVFRAPVGEESLDEDAHLPLSLGNTLGNTLGLAVLIADTRLDFGIFLKGQKRNHLLLSCCVCIGRVHLLGNEG